MDCVETRFMAMGGRCEIRVCGPVAAALDAAAAAAIDEVRRIEAKYSRYRADSIVSRINAAAGSGEWFACDAETATLLDFADTLYHASDGRFDITSGILRRAWDFRAAVVPSAEQLAGLCRLIDWRRVDREAGRVRLAQAGMEIDLGGFGKEYAADRAAAVLVGLGIGHGYVNLGGDLCVVGPQPDGRPWQIGIRDPRRAEVLAASIPVSGGGLATSGDYEKYFERDGRRYCHILDPRSGMPVGDWRSISVLAPRAIAAGSHSTIAMLLGERALEFLDAAGLAYLAIDRDGRLHVADGEPATAAAAGG